MASADPAGDIAAKQSEAQSVQSEIGSLNSQLEAKVESYNAANYELESIQGRIADNQAQLEQTTAQLSETQDRLNSRIEHIYRNGGVDMLDVLMNTSDIDEFLTKYDMLTKLGEQDRNDVEQVKELKVQVEDMKTKLAQDESSQESLVSQLSSEKADIEAGVAQRQSMLASINTDIATLQAQQEAEKAAAFQESIRSDSSGGSDYSGGGNYGTPPPSTAGGAVGIAMTYLGVPYVWGGASRAGVDCSGLTMLVYGELGISLPHFAAAQYAAGTPVSYDELQPGDLVFFGYGEISHVGIYIGGGQMIHAPFEGEVVQIAPVSAGGSFRGGARY